VKCFPTDLMTQQGEAKRRRNDLIFKDLMHPVSMPRPTS
jgi:hypothetical protein